MAGRTEIYKLGWDEYLKLELDVLLKKVTDYINDNKIRIDAVVPLLRGGNIPGTYLAYKLNILRIAPIQYKYFFREGFADLKQVQKLNEELFDKKDSPTFLLVEGNHCFGTSAKYAAKGLKEQFPKCNIIYAASNMDYNYQNAVSEYADICFYGRLNNDCEELDEEKCIELGIDPEKVIIFPWENEDEEKTTFLELKQFPFKDTDETESRSKLCESFDLNKFDTQSKKE